MGVTGTSFVASVAGAVDEALAAVAASDASKITGSLGSDTAAVELPAVAAGAGVVASTCFRLAFTAANRAASLSCRMTFRIRKKNA